MTDPTTGLPALPDGYYWKVQIYWNDYAVDPSVKVSLKRHWYSTVASSDSWLAYSDPRDVEAGREGWERHHNRVRMPVEDYPDQIVKLAEDVLAKEEKSIASGAYHRAYKAAAKKYNGKYPPKTLRTDA